MNQIQSIPHCAPKQFSYLQCVLQDIPGASRSSHCHVGSKVGLVGIPSRAGQDSILFYQGLSSSPYSSLRTENFQLIDSATELAV